VEEVFASLEHTFYGGRVLTFNDLRGQARPGGPALFDVPPVERTFDSPEFRGVTFYEVQAKSLLNRVPGSGLPFNWTVNVYRGCSHACSYCLSGDTPILMADGRTRPMAELRVGDAIYGTTGSGADRRYAMTRVLAHWSTTKPAYRVTLADGTRLVGSGDHRFLTGHGWRHVTAAPPGEPPRPALTPGDRLAGTGRAATAPAHSPSYQRGYLCGLLRADGAGHLGPYLQPRPDRAPGDFRRTMRALVDIEAVERARAYLAELEAAPGRALVTAGAPGPRLTDRPLVEEVTDWPADPPPGWRKGFVAGVLDALGTIDPADDDATRLHAADAVLADQIARCLRALGFATAVRPVSAVDGSAEVRLLGGLVEQMRLWSTVDPAITRRRGIEGRRVEHRAALEVVAIEPLGLELPLFDITTGTGDFIADGVVSHNCFARPTHTYLNFGADADFERRIVVKVNAAEVLRRELRRPSWTGEHVAMGTNTDPYQRCEGRYRLTRSVLEVFKELRNPCSVLTKSPLLTRDLDLMTELRDTAGFSAALSIGTLDEEVWRSSEPGTPHPRARVAAVRTLREAGIECGVLVAPILPGISDHPEQLKAVVGAVAEAGATHISGLTLHLRPGVKEVFMPWLEQHHPELVTRYQRMYRGSNAPKHVRAEISGRVADARRELPRPAPATWRIQDRPRTAPSRPGPPPEQLNLGLG
jgi:DNA repair photolyase